MVDRFEATNRVSIITIVSDHFGMLTEIFKEKVNRGLPSVHGNVSVAVINGVIRCLALHSEV